MHSTLVRRELLLRACKRASFGSRTSHWCGIVASILLCSLLQFHVAAQAQSVEAARTLGLDWLQAQVGSGGALAGESNSIGSAVQVRAEAAVTLAAAGRNVPAALLQYLQTGGTEAEPLARQLVALRAASIDAGALETTLRGLQRSDGGFVAFNEAGQRTDGGVSASAEGSSGLLDTAWALRALADDASRSDATAAWLRQRQSANGAWDVAPRSVLLNTSTVLRGLREIASRNGEAAASASSAASYLLAQRSGSSLWDSSIWLNALVFEAVHDYVAADAPLRGLVRDALLAAQAADGSWSGDPYVTALALRALQLSGLAPANPTLSTLTLQVVDSQTAAGLAGVTLTVRGASNATVTSGAAGNVTLNALTPGIYDATLALPGYTEQLLSFALVAGRTTDIGRIQLSRSASGSPTTARLGGLVTAAGSSQGLSGATVAVGTLPAIQTDTQGRWIVPNVTPGAYQITVSTHGYLSASTIVDVLGGREYDFSPSLQLDAGNSGTDAQGCRLFGTVIRGADGQPLSGATVTLGGANNTVATTNAGGAYLIGNLVSGSTTITVSASGFDTVRGTTAIACQLPSAHAYSPRLYVTGTTPVDANTSSLSFTLVNASNEQVLPGIAVRATPLGQAARNLVTTTEGRVTLSALSAESVLIEIAPPGFDAISVSYQVEPLATKDMGQVRLRPAGGEALLPDLRLVTVGRATAVTHPQTLQVAGAVRIEVTNAGNAPVPRSATAIAFLDLDRDARFDAMVDRQLGQATLTTLLLPGQSTTLEIAVAGQLPFRDAPIHVWIDSHQEIGETNEANNIKSTADAAEVRPSIGAFRPVLKWHWQGSSSFPSYNQVMMAPVVGRVVDTNGDGRIDAQDIPSVVFTTYASDYNGVGVIRVVNGATGVDQLSINDSSAPVAGVGNLALADLDADGRPEIIAIKLDGGLVVFRNDGTRWWSTPPLYPVGFSLWGAPHVADLDGDGRPEVMLGRFVYSFDGQLKWTAQTSYFGGSSISPMSIAADINLDGTQCMLIGPSAFASDGRRLWSTSSVFDGFTAVGNFNADPYPEIVVAGSGWVSLLDRTGRLLWQVTQPGSGFGGPPTISDVDGDGVPDIGISNATRYTVFRADGSVLWSMPIQDTSSNRTGSTVFDFDGDGRAEVLYGDEISVKAFSGPQGNVIWSIPNSTITTHEYPLVVDLDLDGHAEMVTIANDVIPWSNQTVHVHGIRVFRDENNTWVNTRSVWNQHAYSISNINDDLTVPARPQRSWLAHNTYRLNKRLDVLATAVADPTASYVRVRDGGPGGSSTLTVRIGNGGALSTPVGMQVAFYSGSANGTRLGVTTMTRALGPGEFADVSLDVSGSLAAVGLLTAVVDDDGTGRGSVTDFDRTNNTVQADLSALAVSLTLGVTANSPRYNELDTAVFTAAVANGGSFAQPALVRFGVETPDGLLVQELPLAAPVNVAAAMQVPVAANWLVGDTLAGEYRVRAELIDSAGVVYASALAPFSVEASNTAHLGARLSVDRARYSAGQSIQLRSRVHNATVNMLIDGLVATTQIVAPDNQVAWTHDEPAVQIAAGGNREYTYTVPAADLLPGQYSAVLEVRDSLGNLRASSSALFTVLGTDFSGVGLRGALEVPATVALGQTASIGFSVINGGNAALSNVPMTLRIVDPAAGVLRGEFPLSATLAIGATQAGAVNWQAVGQAGDAVAVLAATIGGREQVLAQAPFRLTGTQSSIDLAVTTAAIRDIRVLALVSCLSGDVDEPTCLQQRVNAVNGALAAQGVPYLVVTTAAEFEAQMRCGFYNVFWISGGGRKISEQAAKEVREAVRRGDGLILDGPQNVYDAQDEYLHTAAGVHLYDGTVGESLSAEVLPGSLFDVGTLPTLGSARPFIFTTGQPLAMFDLYYPAIAVNQYGQGKGVLFSFHFADMLSAPGGLANATLQALLDDALQTVAPLPTLLTVADALRSGTEVHNRGGQVVDVEARTTLPLGSTYLDAVPAPAQIVPATGSTGAQVIWRFTLAAGARSELKLRHRLDVTGVTEVGVPTSVYSRNGSADPVLQGSASHALPVADGLALTNAAAAAVQALAPTGEFDQAVRGYALNATESAVQAYGQGDAALALTKWVMVADMVALISTDDVARIAASQAAVAMAIEAATDRLCRP